MHLTTHAAYPLRPAANDQGFGAAPATSAQRTRHARLPHRPVSDAAQQATPTRWSAAAAPRGLQHGRVGAAPTRRTGRRSPPGSTTSDRDADAGSRLGRRLPDQDTLYAKETAGCATWDACCARFLGWRSTPIPAVPDCCARSSPRFFDDGRHRYAASDVLIGVNALRRLLSAATGFRQIGACRHHPRRSPVVLLHQTLGEMLAAGAISPLISTSPASRASNSVDGGVAPEARQAPVPAAIDARSVRVLRQELRMEHQAAEQAAEAAVAGANRSRRR